MSTKLLLNTQESALQSAEFLNTFNQMYQTILFFLHVSQQTAYLNLAQKFAILFIYTPSHIHTPICQNIFIAYIIQTDRAFKMRSPNTCLSVIKVKI